MLKTLLNPQYLIGSNISKKCRTIEKYEVTIKARNRNMFKNSMKTEKKH